MRDVSSMSPAAKQGLRHASGLSAPVLRLSLGSEISRDSRQTTGPSGTPEGVEADFAGEGHVPLALFREVFMIRSWLRDPFAHNNKSIPVARSVRRSARNRARLAVEGL